MGLRHEYKLLINQGDRQVIRGRLKALGLADPNAPRGEYLVRSLYFDDLRDTALRQKLDGVDARDKFRIRYYDGDPSFIRLEKKSKRGGLCSKRGAALSRAQAEAVLRYFVAHNFAVSFDSYTGSMMHNYYLYEEEGRLSMIAWDYNLAFGAFSGMGGGGDGAAEAVNYPIDTPVSGATLEDRPLLGQLLANETYLARYHELFGEFISGYFESGHFYELLARMAALLAPYVGSDPSAFYTLGEFEAGVEALRTFCALRAQSVRGQLDGSIPATAEGQTADASNLVDASGLNLSDMGAMGGGRGRDGGENRGRTTNR